jgi:protein gp37
MGEKTEISWADDTFNPWWGCTHASPGCDNCYAETFAHRIGLQVWGNPKTTSRRTFGEAHWRAPLAWEHKALQAGTRRRVFCSSMADVFEQHAQIEMERQKLWPLIEQTPHLDWLLLTKRPQNFRRM